MAYTLISQVQSTPGTLTSSITRTPVSNAGAFLTVSYRNGGGAALTVSSLTNQASANIPFTAATFSAFNIGAGVGYGQILLWVPVFPAGTTSYTLTLSSTPSSAGDTFFDHCEYTGLSKSLTIDAQAGQTQAAPGAGTDAVTSTAATPSNVLAAGGGIVFGFSGSYSTFESNAAGTGFGNYLAVNPSPGTLGAGAIEDKRITTNAAVAATFTAATGGNTYATQIIVIPEFIATSSAVVAWIL